MVTDVVGGARTYAIKGLQGAYVRCPRREYAHVRHGCRTADRTQRRPRPGCSHRVRGDGQRGLRAQRRTAVRLTVSEAGLDVAWIFGTYRRSWEEIRRIRLLHSRFDPTRIQQIEVVFANHGPLELFDRLSDFNELVAELRETQSQLVED